MMSSGSPASPDARSFLAPRVVFATKNAPMTQPVERQTASSAELVAALWRNAFPRFRLLGSVLTWIYVGGLVLTLAWLEWAGERFWLTGGLLFAPPQVFLLPLLLLTPYCIVTRPRLVVVHAAAAALVLLVFMSYRRTTPPPVRDGEIRLITHNVGEGNRPQFYGFIESEKPDIVAMQDARGRGGELAKRYPSQHVVGRGEFYVISRFPILHSDAVTQATWYGRSVAARFELLCDGKPLILYNVHLPTPRRQLNRFLSGRMLAEMLVDEDSARKPTTYAEWTRARLKLADDLAAVFARETLPFLVCGDFNTPDHGVIYHTVSRQLLDSHLRAGRGWGFTFPGPTHNPFTMGEPWVRIDYAFAGRGWEPIASSPEPGRKSQHCAVVARFAPKSG